MLRAISILSKAPGFLRSYSSLPPKRIDWEGLYNERMKEEEERMQKGLPPLEQKFLNEDKPSLGEVMIETLKPYPIYEHLREFLTPRNMPDWTEVSKAFNIDFSRIDNVPLEPILWDNPVFRVDDPMAKVVETTLRTDEDEEILPKLDFFQMRTLMKRQLELEKKATIRQHDKFVKSLEGVADIGRAAELGPLTNFVTDWYEKLRDTLAERIANVARDYDSRSDTTEDDDHRVSLLTAISPEKLVVLISHEIVGSSFAKQRAAVSAVAANIAEAIRAEANYERFTREEKQRYHAYHGKGFAIRKINLFASILYGDISDWPRHIKQEVGKLLIDIFLEVARFKRTHINPFTEEIEEEEVCPFYVEEVGDRAYLTARDEFIEHLSQKINLPNAKVRHYPMVVPPKPWSTPLDGGYFTSRVPLIRYVNYEQMYPLFKRSEQLETIYKGLNALSSTGWRLNKRVVEVMKALYELGGDAIEIPSRFERPIPEPGPEGKTPQWFKAVKKAQKTNRENFSLRASHLLRMDVIREFEREKIFYYPHSCDFRGRVYPIPVHLNHMGSDLGRGLLEFAYGRRLGPRGFWWLQIHLANLAGMDKSSHTERLQYVRNNFNLFIDCATRPLAGSRVWMEKDDPWQFLAACIEFTNALRSGDPENYISHLPIHQDGTCNGLQHYSALGRDTLGAKSVNVLPSDRPQDVYNEVVKIILQLVEKDAKEGHEMAQLLEGKIQRKVVKQTIMTSVYGVTFIGARQQIENAMLDKFPDFPEDKVFAATVYLARKTFDAIGTMFSGANNIMKWMTTSANLVCKGGQILNWITPLGLVVQQPYRKPGKYDHVNTLLQRVVLKNDEDLPVNARRNATAFPPNYVHSIDSTHMLLTALECHSRGITYASVHDSYWTHASTVDDMNRILREKFVELYKKPLLNDLRNYWIAQNPDVEIPPLPDIDSDFDIELVKKSPYFFH